jgi:hypothetical protein
LEVNAYGDEESDEEERAQEGRSQVEGSTAGGAQHRCGEARAVRRSVVEARPAATPEAVGYDAQGRAAPTRPSPCPSAVHWAPMDPRRVIAISCQPSATARPADAVTGRNLTGESLGPPPRESRKHDISKARKKCTILLIWTFASCFFRISCFRDSRCVPQFLGRYQLSARAHRKDWKGRRFELSG